MHKLLASLVLLFSLSDLPSAVRQYRMFLEAYDRQRTGNLAGASQGYASLLAAYPDGFFKREALFDLAGAEYGLKRYQQASTIYAGLQADKGRIGAHASYNRGNALATIAFANPKAHDYPEQLRNSIACYRRALLANPQDIDARINYEIVIRALRRLTPPPSPASGGGGGKGAPGQGPGHQSLNSDVSNLLLDNARQEEGRMMRRYFRPAPPRQSPKEQKDW
jgi:hypothetical protein